MENIGKYGLGLMIVVAMIHCGPQTIPEARVEIICEQVFDRPVSNAVFALSSGAFYPGIVTIEIPDTADHKGKVVTPDQEVRILNQDGIVTNRLFLSGKSIVEYAEGGKYFIVLAGTQGLPGKQHARSSLTLYDGSGKVIWRKSPYETRPDASPVFYVSPKDGSVLVFGANDEMLYDREGKVLPGPAKLLSMYDDLELLGFSQNWRYFVGRANKSVTERLGNVLVSPQIMYLDSNFIVLWERPLGKYEGSTAGISSAGSYVYTSYAPSDTARNQTITTLGYIYGHYKDRVMMIEYGGAFRAFSENERYLLADYLPRGKKQNLLMLVDIEAKKILFRKEIDGEKCRVADDGSIALLASIRDEYIHENRIQAIVYDKNGTPVFKHKFDFNGSEYGLLDWDGQKLTVSTVDYPNHKIKVYRLTR